MFIYYLCNCTDVNLVYTQNVRSTEKLLVPIRLLGSAARLLSVRNDSRTFAHVILPDGLILHTENKASEKSSLIRYPQKT